MEAAELAVWGGMPALEAHTHLTAITAGPVTVYVAVPVAVIVAGAAVAWPAVAFSSAFALAAGLSESSGPST